MKKILGRMLTLFLLIAMPLVGCQPQTSSSNAKNPPEPEWITPVGSVDLEGMNIYWQHDNIYLEADDSAVISLYVAAGTNEDGEWMFDDGQQWLLIMETSFGIYPLFPRSYVQLGGVSCVVYNDFDEEQGKYNIPHVLVTISQTAGYQIYDHIFDNDKKAFERVTIYDATNINFITSSM